ncbi:MAG: hypothetical protein CVT99_11135 [Bacteroidetes bacterium HGW-Bacteroidetes-16]|jgi:hypothetical protein|nr:MAG: hypothetical protein CVT99_11135 [Bacteroidetes bacterium HGW-Bacteroidetes-16]
MKQILCLVGLFATICPAFSQVIPENRRVDWHHVVANHHFINPEQRINVKDFGAQGDGLTNDQPAVQAAINSLNGRLGAVFFPSGNYLFTSSIRLFDSTVLQGISSDSTTLMFRLGQQTINCINIQKGQSSDFVPITAGFEKDSPWIQVENASSFTVGQTIEIREENGDWDVVPISWADYSVGQITRIIEISGSKLSLESLLRIDYSPELNPQVRPIEPIRNAGVECLKIKRLDAPDEGAGSNISFSYAVNCVVRGVESDSSVGSHIDVNASAYLLFEGCYFHHGFTYDGTGMRGYGVTFSMHSSECRVVNNIFKKLRHAMMVKTGSNGNVIAYNYSIEPFRTEPIPDFSGDISLHGHYAYANLFEGNIVQNLIIDHYWGPSGPENTLFRNRAELYGIVMTSSDTLMTNRQNFVGNEVTNSELLFGLYFLTGEDHFEFGNNIKGITTPAGTDDLPDSSYYLEEQPAFWHAGDWPSIGLPMPLSSGTIPARQRYLDGHKLTVCPYDTIATWISKNNAIDNIQIGPNPATDHLYLSSLLSGKLYFRLMDLQGRLLFTKYLDIPRGVRVKIDLPNSIYPGLYLAVCSQNNKQLITKILITR